MTPASPPCGYEGYPPPDCTLAVPEVRGCFRQRKARPATTAGPRRWSCRLTALWRPVLPCPHAPAAITLISLEMVLENGLAERTGTCQVPVSFRRSSPLGSLAGTLR